MGFEPVAASLFGCVLCGVAACSDLKCPSICSPSDFVVVVPLDRVTDVKSVTATGPCASKSVKESQPGTHFFNVTGEGVCHITVSFVSGAPNFETDVKLIPSTEKCCTDQPEAENNVNVPEPGPADASTRD